MKGFPKKGRKVKKAQTEKYRILVLYRKQQNLSVKVDQFPSHYKLIKRITESNQLQQKMNSIYREREREREEN